MIVGLKPVGFILFSLVHTPMASMPCMPMMHYMRPLLRHFTQSKGTHFEETDKEQA